MEGFSKGETCNRDGCSGIIEEYEKEGSCSCHINPPCGYCTELNAYCETCGWDAKEKHLEYLAALPKQEYTPFKVRSFADLDRTKIDWINQSHTHFSMIKKGVYPEGTSQEGVRKKVSGTFGGRFTRFGNGEFEFIAYTD